MYPSHVPAFRVTQTIGHCGQVSGKALLEAWQDVLVEAFLREQIVSFTNIWVQRVAVEDNHTVWAVGMSDPAIILYAGSKERMGVVTACTYSQAWLCSHPSSLKLSTMQEDQLVVRVRDLAEEVSHHLSMPFPVHVFSYKGTDYRVHIPSFSYEGHIIVTGGVPVVLPYTLMDDAIVPGSPLSLGVGKPTVLELVRRFSGTIALPCLS